MKSFAREFTGFRVAIVLFALIYSSVSMAGISAITRGGTQPVPANCAPALSPSPMADNLRPYCDRLPPTYDYYWSGVAGTLVDQAEYVVVANDDKNIGDYTLQITVDVSGTLYLLWNDLIAVPAWVTAAEPAGRGFTDTGENITLTTGVNDPVFSIYELDVVNGDITLNEDNSSNSAIYSVAFVEDPLVDISVTGTDNNGGANVVAGSGSGNIDYTYTVTNAGPDIAGGVTSELTLTISLGSAIGCPAPTATQGTVTIIDAFTAEWSGVTLAPTESADINLLCTADSSVPHGDVFAAGVTVTSISSGTDTVPGNDSATLQSTIVREFDLGLAVVDTPDPVIAGSGAGNLVHTITLSRSGPSDAAGVAVAVVPTLPAGVSIDSWVESTGPGTFDGTTWTVGDWPASANGVNETLAITLTVDSSAAACIGCVSAEGTVSATSGTDTGPNPNTASNPTSIIRQFDLSLAVLDTPDPVVAGLGGPGNLTHTFTLSRSGPSDAAAVTASLTNLIAPVTGVNIDSIVPDVGSMAPDGTTWLLGDLSALANGVIGNLVITLTVDSSAVECLNCIEAEYTVASTDVGADTDPLNDVISDPTSIDREVDIVVTKTESIDPVVAGSGTGNLVYTVTVENQGPSNVTDASFTEDVILPANVTIDSVAVTSGTLGGVSPNYTWTFAGDTLAVGVPEQMTVTLTVPLTADEGTDVISNTAAFVGSSGGEFETDDSDNSATEATSVRWPEATFNVTKAYEDAEGPQVPVTLECTDTSGLLVYAPQNGTTATSLVVRRFDHSSDVAAPTTSCTVIESEPPGFHEVDRTDGCDVDPTSDGDVNDCQITNAVTVAYFNVTKMFSDSSPTEVDVTLTCNTGLPLEQTFTISDGNPVTFVVTNFVQGTMDCEITEMGEGEGYEPVYNNGTVLSDISCLYESVEAGGETFVCMIGNAALPASFTVNKVWEFLGESGDDIYAEVDVSIYCRSEIFEQGAYQDNGYWVLETMLGDGEHITVSVDTTLASAECMAMEFLPENSGVETSDDCGWREIPAGGSSECTITNTAFFEGIPTLSQYGMALMALLMLGMGFVGMRRFI